VHPRHAGGGSWQFTWVKCGSGPQAWSTVYPSDCFHFCVSVCVCVCLSVRTPTTKPIPFFPGCGLHLCSCSVGLCLHTGTFCLPLVTFCCFQPLRCNWGGGYLPPRPGFLTTAPKLLGIFWNASLTFPRYLLATEPEKNFSHISLLSPKFWWEMKGTPGCQMVKKTGFKCISGYACRRWKNTTGISMFSCAYKLVLTSLDCICKPEVEIHQNRK